MTENVYVKKTWLRNVWLSTLQTVGANSSVFRAYFPDLKFEFIKNCFHQKLTGLLM